MLHQVVSLDKLVDLLKEKKEKIKLEAYVKEEELIKLVNHGTHVLIDYEKMTGEMIELLHNIRDEQVQHKTKIFKNICSKHFDRI